MRPYTETDRPLTFSTAQFLIGVSVLVLGSGIAWGTITAQLQSNRETLARIEQLQREQGEELKFIRSRQIHNEGILDQHSHELDDISGFKVDRRSAADGPKK